MFPKQKRKKHFSFDIKVFNNQSKKNIKSNSINLRDIRDIFMRKQDVYLIKLLEKRIKLMKMLNSKSPNNNNKIKLMNSLPFKLHKDLNKTEKNLINKKINFKNIRIKNIKTNKTEQNSRIAMINNKYQEEVIELKELWKTLGITQEYQINFWKMLSKYTEKEKIDKYLSYEKKELTQLKLELEKLQNEIIKRETDLKRIKQMVVATIV